MRRQSFVLLLVALTVAVAGLAPVQAVFNATTSTSAQRVTAGTWTGAGTSLWWAGANSNGMAGEAGTQDSVAARVPQTVADAGTFSQVTTGANFGCAIRAAASGGQPAGLAICWGYNNNGQAGNGTSGAFNTTPQTVTGGYTWSALAASSSAVCGIRADTGDSGTLYCWGYWQNQQMGDTVQNNRAVPTKPVISTADTRSPFDVSVGPLASISGASTRFCAITTAQALWCWGDNSTGAIGTGATSTGGVAPVQIAPAATWSQVSTGASHTCAVAVSGTLPSGSAVVPGAVYCWGAGGSSRLGDGTTTDHYTPAIASALLAAVPGQSWSKVVSGSKSTCALTATGGQLWCWGAYPFGGSVAAIPLQVTDSGTSTWSAVSLNPGNGGGSAVCAISATDSSLQCVGENGYTYGDGTSSARNTMGLASGGLAWSSVALGNEYGCGTTTTARLYCWGKVDTGQLGTGAQLQWPALRDTGAGTGAWSAVSSTSGHACALKGTVAYCWGAGGSGRLGNGAKTDYGTPQQVSGSIAWGSVTGGVNFSCGLSTAGVAYCWGAEKRVGNGLVGEFATPQAVLTSWTVAGSTVSLTGSKWTALDSGQESTCGVRNDGSLWCWGYNTNGQLGNGTSGSNTESNPPVRVGTATDWATVQVGTFTVCATKRGGALYCWGNNANGQVGNGTSGGNVTTPVAVTGTSDGVFTDYSVGSNFVCGIDTQGRMWCWGSNGNGQFGNGTNTPSSSAVLAGNAAGGRRWTTVSAGQVQVCGVSTDGTYCSGANGNGQFGLGDTSSTLLPRRVSTDALSVAIGEFVMWVVR